MMKTVSKAKQAESCQNVTVTGMIASYSTSYKVVSKSEWESSNLESNLQGSETYTPPLLVPIEKLDNTRGFNVRCFKCGSTAFAINHTYRNARAIQLEDADESIEGISENIDRLEVVLYDNASLHVIPGEIVDIVGDIYIQRKSDSRSNKKLVNVLHCSEIRYRNKEKVVITPKDIEIFYKHKQICKTAYQKELEAAARLNNNCTLPEHKR